MNNKKTAQEPKAQEQSVVLIPQCTVKLTNQQYEKSKRNLEFDLQKLRNC